MVFQHSTLFDSMTCAENVALPLRKHKGLSHKAALTEALRRLEIVHMQDFAEHYPSELGDGMRKRVAIARALTLDPRYVLFDEPTTSLDPVSARRVDTLIRELSDKLGVTSIVVSHDLASIFSIADRIVMLYKGKVRLLGPPDHFHGTGDGVVQQFIHGHATGPMDL
jgi:phospholipid/cholesterol/gamma-HCH transport system ATP-binding protein